MNHYVSDDLREEIDSPARGVYDWMIEENYTPPRAAAAATYILGLYTNKKSSQQVIADHFGIPVSAVQKACQYCWEHREEWSIQQDKSDLELLKGLKSRKMNPGHSGESKAEIRKDIRKLIESDEESESLLRDEFRAITGRGNPLKQIETLRDDFSLNFGHGEDFTVNIQVNKEGVRKIREHLRQNGKQNE